MKKDTKDAFIGIGIIIFVFICLLILAAMVLTILYYIGWLVGFLMNIVIGIDGLVFGVTFPQLFGILTICMSMVLSGIGLTFAAYNKKIEIDKLRNKIKEYRGY